jgi:hypothetical protein
LATVFGGLLLLVAIGWLALAFMPVKAGAADPSSIYAEQLQSPQGQNSQEVLSFYPACARSLIVTTLYADGPKTVIQGFARPSLAGKKLSVTYGPTGKKVVGTTTIPAGGYWGLRIKRPKKPSPVSPAATYKVSVGSEQSAATPLFRRAVTSRTEFSGGALQVAGYVVPPSPAKAVTIERLDNCTAVSTVGMTPLNKSDGKFSAALSIPKVAVPTTIFVRVKVKVKAYLGKKIKTVTRYSLPQPVVLFP